MDRQDDRHPGASPEAAHRDHAPFWVRNETKLPNLLDFLTVAVSPWPESKAYFLLREFGASGVTFMDDARAVRYLLNKQTSE